MIEDHYFLRAGRFFQKLLHLRIIDPFHFLAIVEVAYRGLLPSELESLLVERELPDNGAGVSNRNHVQNECPADSGSSRGRFVCVVDRFLGGFRDIVEGRLDGACRAMEFSGNLTFGDVVHLKTLLVRSIISLMLGG